MSQQHGHIIGSRRRFSAPYWMGFWLVVWLLGSSLTRAENFVEIRARIVEAETDEQNGLFLLTFDKGRMDGLVSGQTFLLMHRGLTLSYGSGVVAKLDDHVFSASFQKRENADARALMENYEAIFKVARPPAPPPELKPLPAPPVVIETRRARLGERLNALARALVDTRWTEAEVLLGEAESLLADDGDNPAEVKAGVVKARRVLMVYLQLRNQIRSCHTPPSGLIAAIRDLPAIGEDVRRLPMQAAGISNQLLHWADEFTRIGAEPEAAMLHRKREEMLTILADEWWKRLGEARAKGDMSAQGELLRQWEGLPTEAIRRLDGATVADLRRRHQSWIIAVEKERRGQDKLAEGDLAAAEAAFEESRRHYKEAGFEEEARRQMGLLEGIQGRLAELRGALAALSHAELSMRNQMAKKKGLSRGQAKKWKQWLDDFAHKNASLLAIHGELRISYDRLRQFVESNTASGFLPW